MKFIIVFAALFAVALADHHDVKTLRQDSFVHPDGFKFGVETSDGAKHDAEGVLNDAGTEHESIAVHGSYTFVDKNGEHYTVEYVADKNGFQPKGAHIPHI